MTQHEDYATAGREFLAKAQEALASGDLRQASEKGWGAAAQMVKAIAEQRGWPHSAHRDLNRAISRLVQETGRRELIRLFRLAGDLHTNFYEDWLPPDQVTELATSVRELLNELNQLVEA